MLAKEGIHICVADGQLKHVPWEYVVMEAAIGVVSMASAKIRRSWYV